ncbi:hypothetical protein ANTHOS_180 [Bacillus phage Anthos]|uniref:Uncharacterized protein n=1 Tax=Bacillus phage Anthos TaxID=2796502 RepID=A0A7U3T8U0_9CAUD|nr:hypothetical protein ANTHOS_180 [Bacillus phage Anthos]
MAKENSARRSISRGVNARGDGTKNLNNNGADAYNNALKKKEGKYKPSFVEPYDNLTERELSLKLEYAKDLLSKHLGVTRELIKLETKRSKKVTTLTSLDEVYYVKVGTTILGKMSIRTQRTWKSTSLLFVYQEKQVMVQEGKGAFSKTNVKTKSKGVIGHDKRKSYNKNKRK